MPPPMHMVTRPRPATALSELMDQLRSELGAGGAERVAEGDGAAVHVQAASGIVELAHDGQRLGSEASLNSIRSILVHGQPRLGEGFRHGLDGPDAHHVGRHPRHRKRHQPGQRAKAERLRALGAHHGDRRGPVGEGTRVSGGDTSTDFENGREFRHPLERRIGAWELVLREQPFLHLLHRALPADRLHRHGDDLVGEWQARPLRDAQ